jgi:glycosyltransferase involved in cell wall biosynthesis
MRRQAGRLVFDMDDAFWTHPPQFRQIGRWLRDPSRTDSLIALSDHVLAGNRFLADYAGRLNPNVSIIPTAIDTQRYTVRPRQERETVTVGWVGRWSSADYLRELESVFQRLVTEHPRVRILLIGAPDLGLDVERLSYRRWSLQREIVDLQEFDIGIMPLPDDEYSRGKCGFKMLQYMGVGVPVVVSPVGVNEEIIQDGENGFTARTEEEWIDKLSDLVRDAGLRTRIGLAGRRTVEERFSTSVVAPRIRQILRETART